ncbi:Uncharacterized protein DAT39_000209, partial [Clarias magur]
TLALSQRPVSPAVTSPSGSSATHTADISEPPFNIVDSMVALLSTPRKNVTGILRYELQSMFADELYSVKSEIQALNVELYNSMVSPQADMAQLKNTTKEK